MARDVFIASITSATDDDGAFGGGYAFNSLHKRLHSIGVVAVVGNDRAATIVKNVKASGGGLSVVDEGGHAGFDSLPVEPQGPGRCDRSHCIFDLKTNRAIARQGDGT